MKIEKTIKYQKRISIFDWIQYFISGIITICFVIGLIPGYYNKIATLLIAFIVVQILISILRLRLLNMILELFILLISIISLVPFLGWFFRFLGIITGILEMASFKNYKLYKQVEIKTFKRKNPNKAPIKKRIHDKPIKDADYKEK
ncbi:MAG: hypothetical protein KC589_03095 [Nanoarchaeota archaeon]|nr:hypothetical protein [Nanoarchaeota archaeon]